MIAIFALVLAKIVSGTECSWNYGQPGATNLQVNGNDRRRLIVSGDVADATSDQAYMEYPFYAKLSMGCGGAVIGREWILTAAHCFDSNADSGVTVTLNGANGGVVMDVQQIIMHEQYDKTALTNDIALVRVNEIDCSGSVQAVKMLDVGFDIDGCTGFFCGTGGLWEGGADPGNTLQEVIMDLHSHSYCNDNYFGVGTQDSITELQMCARQEDDTTEDTCQGDSGGPAFIDMDLATDAHTYVHAGVVSYGVGCGREPGVYTATSAYKSWILGHFSGAQFQTVTACDKNDYNEGPAPADDDGFPWTQEPVTSLTALTTCQYTYASLNGYEQQGCDDPNCLICGPWTGVCMFCKDGYEVALKQNIDAENDFDDAICAGTCVLTGQVPNDKQSQTTAVQNLQCHGMACLEQTLLGTLTTNNVQTVAPVDPATTTTTTSTTTTTEAVTTTTTKEPTSAPTTDEPTSAPTTDDPTSAPTDMTTTTTTTTTQEPQTQDPVTTTTTTNAPDGGASYAQGGTYEFATKADAQTACEGMGMELCTSGQLFAVVYADGSDQADLCYSGWIADTYRFNDAGWFNAQEGSCGSMGWNSWAPDTPGAHCCSSDVEDLTVPSCDLYNCGTGFQHKDSPSDIYCAVGSTCDSDTCCEAWSASDLYVGLGGYDYASGADAKTACEASHSDRTLCTRDQLIALAETTYMCSSGWFQDVGTDSYERGWYVGQSFADAGQCQGIAGERTWKDDSGLGSAHCCVPSYHNSGYIKNDAGTGMDQTQAQTYCEGNGYSYTLCSNSQLETVVNIERPNVCSSGWLSDGTVGWWQGNVDESGCGAANTFNTWVSATPSAHCCLDYVTEAAVTSYGILPTSGNYADSTFANGAAANTACLDAGYTGGVCSMGQQAYVEENPATYGDIACKVGWVEESEGSGTYISGYWSGCGNADSWNDAWQPTQPVAHCCQADVPVMDMVQKAYFNGNYDYSYTTMEDAAAMCTGDYSLCSVAQVTHIATEGVLLSNGETQVEASICRLGWTSDGGMGWYQNTEGQCGATGWRSFDSVGATYHCCTNFNAGPVWPKVFMKLPTGYAYANEAEARSACQAENADYSLCSQAEITQAATTGVETDENGWDAVDPQHGLCFSAYVDSSRSDVTHGWYEENGSCGDGWQSWIQSDGNAGAYCCYSQAFNAVTESPHSLEPTQAPVVMVTTQSPSAVFVPGLPSSVDEPNNCELLPFAPDRFEDQVQYCSVGGTVYMNGRDTCVPSDSANLETALQDNWDTQWDLAAGSCTGGRDTDTALDDQMWITNEMVNHAQEDLDAIEANTETYVNDWNQQIIDMVEAQMDHYDTATQNALNNYLDTLRD